MAFFVAFGSSNKAVAQEPYSFLAEHNGSLMTVKVGATSEDAATVMIYYLRPRPGLASEGVGSGTLLFDGAINYEVGYIGGNARVFKAGCAPLTYEVRGSSNDRNALNGFVLLGPSPVFNKEGCSFDHYSTDDRARLVFRRTQKVGR
jgi:hypothetical protein